MRSTVSCQYYGYGDEWSQWLSMDEKVRKGYERTLREIMRDIVKANERPGTGGSPVRSPSGTARNGDVDDPVIETPKALKDPSQ